MIPGARSAPVAPSAPGARASPRVSAGTRRRLRMLAWIIGASAVAGGAYGSLAAAGRRDARPLECFFAIEQKLDAGITFVMSSGMNASSRLPGARPGGCCAR